MSPSQRKFSVKKIVRIFIVSTSIAILLFFMYLNQKKSMPQAEDFSQPIPYITDTFTKEKEPLRSYVEIKDGCGPHFEGPCINVRTGPKSTAKVVYKLRNGVILPVKSTTVFSEGRVWYEIDFTEWLRYPKRVNPNLYVAAEFVKPFLDQGDQEFTETANNSKRILIDRSEQMLYAYDGDVLFMKEKTSTGLDTTPTPRGTFTVYRKTPSRYMQGPIPNISDHYYDLPGVPWNLYFSKEGAVIHGAYWHTSFGKQWSNGCVNLPVSAAEKLYKWTPVGTKVLVQD